MRVGVWLYNSNVIGYIEQSHDQRLYTYLFNPSPWYHPSRSYWDDNEWIPSMLPDEIDSQHARDFSHYSTVWDRSGHYGDLTYYEMTNGSEVYTTRYGNYYNRFGYREWTHNDTLYMESIRNQLITYDSYIDKILPILLLVVSWLALIISVLLCFGIIYFCVIFLITSIW